MMKKMFQGGLQSLIPRRDVADPDALLDELDDDFEAAEEELQDEEAAEAEELTEDEAVAVEEAVEEAEAAAASEIPEVATDEVEPVKSTMPGVERPNVTPLTFDVAPLAPTQPELTTEMDEVAADVAQEGSNEQVKEGEEMVSRGVAVREVSEREHVAVAETEVEPVAQEMASTEIAELDNEEAEDVDEAVSRTSDTLKPETLVTEIPDPGPTKDTEKAWDKHEEDVLHILIKDIAVNSNQPRHRFNEVAMEELVKSIAHHGILQPLVVRRVKDRYELIAGERRLRAATQLGWDTVPCVVRRDVSSGASQLELALIENIQRQDLNPIEEALAYRQLNEEYGMTHEEIGDRVGRSRVGVTNVIRVLQLPEEVQQGIVAGKIAIGHAKAILMIPDEERQIKFYRHLVEEGLTVRKAETRARRIQRTMHLDDPMRQKRRGRSAFEMKYSGLLEDRYGYDSKLKFNEQRNRFEVVFKCHSRDEIQELLGRLMGTTDLPKDVSDGEGAEDEE